MTIDRINKISHICAGVSLLFIVFALIAPSIFTAKIGLPDYWDFTEKGQIGDTIGGTMGPFIAIAGVLMTFIAFLMQVNANRIQSEQLKKSFSLRSLENKLASRNALELLSVDIKMMLKSIETLSKEIDQFCENTNNVPTGEYQLHFVSFLSVNRYQTLDRNLLYEAFQSYVETDDKISLFMKLYTIMDYSSDGIKSIHDDIYIPFIDDIMSIKNYIPEELKIFNRSFYESYSINSIDANNLYGHFNKELSSFVIKDGVINVAKLYELLLDEKYKNLYIANESGHLSLLDHINSLIHKNKMFAEALKDARNRITSESYDCLKDISEKVDNALVRNTQDSIRAEFAGHF